MQTQINFISLDAVREV